MNDDLNYLFSRTRIVETINRYWDTVKNGFISSALFHMSSMGVGPRKEVVRDDIIGMWDEGLKRLQVIHHQVGNFLVRVDGTEANAFCYVIASHYLTNDTGINTRTFVGSYDIGLIFSGDNWVVDKFRFKLTYIGGNRDLEQV